MAADLSGVAAGAATGAVGEGVAADSDRSVRVSVPRTLAEAAGAILMDMLGPFEEEQPAAEEPSRQVSSGAEERTVLVFYPAADGPATREELLPFLPEALAEPGILQVEAGNVSRDWVESWRRHFRPIVIGMVRIRSPWDAPSSGAGTECGAPPSGQGVPTTDGGLIDVVINPGLGFGTGLHPTTRGTLLLLQEGAPPTPSDENPAARKDTASGASHGPLVDVGTGSGILAIAASKLGWGPVVAFDNDPVALVSARQNVAENSVESEIEVREADTDSAEEGWFDSATVLANMTLEPVSLLLRRLTRLTVRPRRLVVSGILAGSQEEQIMLVARESGFAPRHRLYEGEWVTFELLPDRADS